MGEGLHVVQQAYEAFARRDIPALLNLVADEVDWKVVGPASLPHCSLRRNPTEVADFFTDLGSVEELTVFEPREFMEAGENVTVLGYLEAYTRDTNQKFQSEWVNVFTVQNGKITRYRGFSNTAARYGH
jgi:ketosteroid isomerase-like protein